MREARQEGGSPPGPAPTTRQVAETVLLDAEQRNLLLSYAQSRFGIARTDGEDLLQDIAVELLRQRAEVQNPTGFVFAAFRARCRRFLLNHRERREVFSQSLEACETSPHPAGPEKTHRRVALRQALAVISVSCRRLLFAYYIEGLSLQETAECTPFAYSGVHKTINRCLRRLRACMN